jgi:hypothetical protein
MICFFKIDDLRFYSVAQHTERLKQPKPCGNKRQAHREAEHPEHVPQARDWEAVAAAEVDVVAAM